MSTSAILPISTIDFNSTTSTPSEQTVFQNILSQLEQSVGSGDLTTSQSLLNTIDALSPSSAAQSSPLGTFLSSLSTAISDGSTSEAASALTTYQNAVGTTSPSDSSTTTAATSAATARATAATIAGQLIQSQNQLLLDTAFASLSNSGQSSSTGSSSSTGVNSLYSLLNAAYSNSASPSASSTSSSPSSTSATSSTSSTPYDTLVSSIQASLAAGDGTLTPALAYLQASGNFVNTNA